MFSGLTKRLTKEVKILAPEPLKIMLKLLLIQKEIILLGLEVLFYHLAQDFVPYVLLEMNI